MSCMYPRISQAGISQHFGLQQVWAGRLAWPSTAAAGDGVSEASAKVRRWRGSETGAVWQQAMGTSCFSPATMLLQQPPGGIEP